MKMSRQSIKRQMLIVVFVTLCLVLPAPAVAAADEPPAPPNDSLWGEQWAYSPSPGVGINLLEAWRYTKGTGVVVAIIDSGLVAHLEFDGRVLPGYDFISDLQLAGDGDGRDADASDPGDWVSSEEIASGTVGADCEIADSVWHGTHVAGIVAAAANNAAGVAGIAPEAKILPVRVIGKCGGSEADMIDGIRWAAGLVVDGAPLNPNPASVINISLGSTRPCTSQLQATVDEVSALNSIIVTSVGNDNHDSALKSPANCLGTVTVAALNREGRRAFYSNYGPAVDLAAPGGDRADGILSTVDVGTTIPQGLSYKSLIGTSMAAPMVSGVLALARSIDPSTSRIDLLTVLLSHLAPFVEDPVPFSCSLGNMCGAGVIDAGALLDALEARTSSTVTSTVALGMRIGTKQSIRVFVDDILVEPTLEGTGACRLVQRVLRAVSSGACVLTYQRAGTAETRNINLRYAIRAVKTAAPKVTMSLPGQLQVGQRVVLAVKTIASGQRSFISQTPSRCRVSSAGTVRGLQAGSCTIQLRVAPANGFISRSTKISFSVLP